ncbi:hypothetical protein [Cellvibrio sp. PSBB023]|uniref:hypothetical protein n=1 Tax=Cellvibrio sp. PSBB023 TaxID=1945512 RepID=UPI00098F6C24|nr:hypothetical protein [Cellvibrio sp. PSBB023]AQT58893.1 hypothetical protein B0D95_01405 [Cellvibrio sp. PSBB023]
MNSAEVLEKYKSVLFKAKIVSVIAIIFAIPKLFIGFTSYTTFLGISSNVALLLFTLGFVPYIVFFYSYWKCPSCNKFPGSGWARKECQHCHVMLKE